MPVRKVFALRLSSIFTAVSDPRPSLRGRPGDRSAKRTTARAPSRRRDGARAVVRFADLSPGRPRSDGRGSDTAVKIDESRRAKTLRTGLLLAGARSEEHT